MNLKSTLITLHLASGLAVIAQAAPATYTFSGTAGGTVNGTPFTAAAFTIRVFADTGSIRPGPPNFFQVDDLFSTLDLAGFCASEFHYEREGFCESKPVRSRIQPCRIQWSS